MEKGNTGKAGGQREAPSKSRKRQMLPIYPSIWERIPLGVYVLAISLVILALGIGVPAYFGALHMSSMEMSSPGAAALPLAEVGKPATAVSLKDPYGQTYTLTPGDGKNHLLVFYMGYF